MPSQVHFKFMLIRLLHTDNFIVFVPKKAVFLIYSTPKPYRALISIIITPKKNYFLHSLRFC